MDFCQVGELLESIRVTEWNIENAVMGESRHGIESGCLLSSTGAGRRNEDSSIFASEFTSGPQSTGGIPEGLMDVQGNNQIRR